MQTWLRPFDVVAIRTMAGGFTGGYYLLRLDDESASAEVVLGLDPHGQPRTRRYKLAALRLVYRPMPMLMG